MNPSPHGPFLLSLFAGLLLSLIALPAVIAVARPLWLPMLLVYWTLRDGRVPTLIAALVCGLLLDAAFATLLGQHALGLVIVVTVALRLRGLFPLLPAWQSTLLLAPVWAGYTLLMFWIDGVSGHAFDAWARWLPVASTLVLWPLLAALLDGVLNRRRERD